jgi:hypothetical protein
VLLDDLVEDGVLGTAAAIRNSSVSLRGDDHVGVRIESTRKPYMCIEWQAIAAPGVMLASLPSVYAEDGTQQLLFARACELKEPPIRFATRLPAAECARGGSWRYLRGEGSVQKRQSNHPHSVLRPALSCRWPLLN